MCLFAYKQTPASTISTNIDILLKGPCMSKHLVVFAQVNTANRKIYFFCPIQAGAEFSRAFSFKTQSLENMKLLTHNMLACHIKGVKNNYPFIIEAAQVETRDADFNPGACMVLGVDDGWPMCESLRRAACMRAGHTFSATAHLKACRNMRKRKGIVEGLEACYLPPPCDCHLRPLSPGVAIATHVPPQTS